VPQPKTAIMAANTFVFFVVPNLNFNVFTFDYPLWFQSDSFFIFSQFDWICCNGPQGVCACVCLCVCLSVRVSVSSLQPKRMDRFWWNFPQIIFYEFAQYVFLRFWKVKFDDVMAAILAVFGSGTFTFAILLRFSSNFRTC